MRAAVLGFALLSLGQHLGHEAGAMNGWKQSEPKAMGLALLYPFLPGLGAVWAQWRVLSMT